MKCSLNLDIIIWAILLRFLFWSSVDSFLCSSTSFLRVRKAWVPSLLVAGQRQTIRKIDSDLWAETGRSLRKVSMQVSVGSGAVTEDRRRIPSVRCSNSEWWQHLFSFCLPYRSFCTRRQAGFSSGLAWPKQGVKGSGTGWITLHSTRSRVWSKAPRDLLPSLTFVWIRVRAEAWEKIPSDYSVCDSSLSPGA